MPESAAVVGRSSRDLLEPLAIAALMTVLDIAVAGVIVLLFVRASLFAAVSDLLLLEFAVLLIVGACMMGRQPLNDEDRYDSAGRPVRSWQVALVGRTLLLVAVYSLLFIVLFTLLAFVT